MSLSIACIGGGPASLYFSLLLKQLRPDAQIDIYERNPPNMTWGFGVVFSDSTMENFRQADAKTHKRITDQFVHWDDITLSFKGRTVRSTGHGFAGMQRLKLITILEERAVELGVRVHHNTEVKDIRPFAKHDLVVAGDGISSFIRAKYEDKFETDIQIRPNKFVWLGTSKPFDSFNFLLKRDAHGLWVAHCYQYMPGHSTFILETSESAWKKAGLEKVSETDTVAFATNLFKDELKGEKLLTNNSIWRSFPRVKNGRYFHKNIVLLGDALHSAHFSIGSGTKLAMEDAIALVSSMAIYPDLQEALAAFQAMRQPVVDSLQRSAQVSMEWFERIEPVFEKLEPVQFAYSLLTRSLRIDHENLRNRDPETAEKTERWFADRAYATLGQKRPKGPVPPPIFTPLKLRDLTLPNRVVVSPMCQYRAENGVVGDWHMVHLGSRAVGGAGLVMTESTAVSPQGRITLGCAGLYDEAHVTAWKRIVDFVHAEGETKIGVQLCHSGRRGSTKLPWEGKESKLDQGNWEIIAPSAIAYSEANLTPRAMTRADMDWVKGEFVGAVEKAVRAGFDLVEIHFAHGYLLSTFLSPLANTRTDEYGGSLGNRLRYPLEVFEACRAAWPEHKPMSVRISATDWADGGFTPDDAVAVAAILKRAGADIIDVSAGQVVEHQRPVYGRLFQTPFSERVRLEADVPTMTVGNIQSYNDANGILAAGRADLVVLARAHLFDPYWTRHAAAELGWAAPTPNPYAVLQNYTMRFK